MMTGFVVAEDCGQKGDSFSNLLLL